ncbi:MAG TPA: hypothetical protein VGD96_11685 [Bradyrhizobium sp.]
MSQVRDKAQGLTKQVIGQMIGDELLVREGKEQERAADKPHETERRHGTEEQDEHPQPKR